MMVSDKKQTIMKASSRMPEFQTNTSRVRILYFVLVCFFFLYLCVSYYPAEETQPQLVYITEDELLLPRLTKLETRTKLILKIFNERMNTSEKNNIVVNKTVPISPEKDDYDLGELNNLFSVQQHKHDTSLITQSRCMRQYTLIVLLISDVSHFSRRDTIRRTWGQDKFNRWKTFFLVGRTHNIHTERLFAAELKKHKDMILVNVYEDFYNMTSKVQAGLEWSTRYCEYKYLFKGNDNTFINFPRLFSFLKSPDTPTTELYAGNVQYEARVERRGKYRITKDEYKGKTYPRYCSGGGYVLSKDVVKRLLKTMPYVSRISIDDAYIGQLALKSGIDVTPVDNFKMFEDKENAECVFKSETIVHHPVETNECMIQMFRKSLLQKGEFL